MEDSNKTSQAKKKIGVFFSIIIIIGVVYGVYWFLHARQFISTEDAYINGNQNVVTSQVGGIIKGIYVENTQEVKKGQLLAEIDDTDYKIALNKAEADLGKTVRAYSNLASNVTVSNEMVNAMKGQYDKALIDYNMDNRSYKAGLISTHQLQTSKNNLQIAKANLEKAKSSYEEAKLQASSSDIYSHPDIQQGIAAYKTAYSNLMRTKIYAAEDGVIAKKAIFLGQQVMPSQQLMAVINLNNIWIDANFKETQLKNIKIGNVAKIKSDVNRKEYTGYVQGISGGSGSALSLLPAQNATGNWIKIVQRIPVRIVFSQNSLEKNGVVPVGSSLEVTVDTAKFINDIQPFKGDSTDLYSIDETEFNKIIDRIIKNNLINK